MESSYFHHFLTVFCHSISILVAAEGSVGISECYVNTSTLNKNTEIKL